MNFRPDDDDDSDDEIDPFKSAMLPPQLQEAAVTVDQENQLQNVEESKYYLASIASNLVIRQVPSEGISFQLWPAATTLVTLLDNLIRHPEIPTDGALSKLFETKDGNRPLRILELGSGTGLVGIAAAAVLGANVTVTDLPRVIPNLRFNIEANSEILKINGGEVIPAALSWGETGHMEALGRDYDLMLGSDLVYHDHLYAPLIETVKWFLLGNGGKELVFVMAHLKRWKKESAFFKMAKKLFDVQVIHTDPPLPGTRVGVVVYKFVGRGTFPNGNSELR
ncbi:OLC1v1025371C1 [Oldenlandia corymbosa var. corymbosa]|uniref:OLC1v1025371C1 n=1 Tax=Oldenlandia corymbosa var. corymbosa TaxID=529605 RepID=A0AAV1C4M5_OLDCO|nr:OLC1v1025371C1 [Oldenlandia corymbosa var. corymbosa]